MYKFDLDEGISTPLISEEFQQVHDTRKQMLFPKLDRLSGKYHSFYNRIKFYSQQIRIIYHVKASRFY